MKPKYMDYKRLVKKQMDFHPKQFSWEGSTPVLFWTRRIIFELKCFALPLYPACNPIKTQQLFPRIHQLPSQYFLQDCLLKIFKKHSNTTIPRASECCGLTYLIPLDPWSSRRAHYSNTQDPYSLYSFNDLVALSISQEGRKGKERKNERMDTRRKTHRSIRSKRILQR